ncbi:formimidoylglutamase [Cecembia sp.]|uniref:formimidoylglutamase n=1 Tax=Cecembia sp. TaxID=1898110 RepID=UPI0025C3CEF4|nr:formimidoylglutamase [Cecembia sp.]
MSIYQSTPQALWSGRNTDSLQYWHQAVTCLNSLEFSDQSTEKKLAILGYAGEEGVKRNQGRIGTSKGPMAIRKMMGPMAYHLPKALKIYDLGDVGTEGDDMEASHDLLYQTIKGLLSKKAFPLILGGGHDLAFPHGRAVMEYCMGKGEKLGIINLDAHFDIRPKVDGKGHSGSPFLELATSFPKNFEYLCLGIQSAANTPELLEKANQLRVQWLEMEEFTMDNWTQIREQLDTFCQSMNKIYLSIDLDGFSSSIAPGVSAPSPWGFSTELIAKVLKWIAQSGKLISMDVVELNPKFDQDNITSKLAARCVEFTLRNFFVS